MPHGAQRLDGYGRPLPELAEARREVLRERPFNQHQRRELLRRLDEQFETLLRRGTHAEVCLTFSVQDGMIQADISVRVTQQYRSVREE